jgi:hypothetical protein
MRIYVAGPYSGKNENEILTNVRAAMEAGEALMRAGHQPFIPHLAHFIDYWQKFRGRQFSCEQWLEWGLSWIEVCDGVFLLKPSPGANKEVARAEALGKPVYFSLKDIPDGLSITRAG